jgi:flagellar biosynthesis chaperone FliJ
MKNKTVLCTLFAAVLTLGCRKEETVSQQLDKAETKTKAAVQDLKDYSFAQKDEFVKTMQGQWTNLNQNLDQLAVKIDSASEAVKAEAKPKLDALRDQFAKLDQQLAEAQDATESTWDSLKAGTKKAYEAVEQGVKDSRQWVSEKIAP